MTLQKWHVRFTTVLKFLLVHYKFQYLWNTSGNCGSSVKLHCGFMLQKKWRNLSESNTEKRDLHRCYFNKDRRVLLCIEHGSLKYLLNCCKLWFLLTRSKSRVYRDSFSIRFCAYSQSFRTKLINQSIIQSINQSIN